MNLTHYGHACVLADITVGDSIRRVLFDPGTYSLDFESVRGIDLVLITHAHPDHLDVDRLVTLLSDNPTAELVLGAASHAALADRAEIAADRIHVVTPGEKLSLRGIDIQVTGGEHACIHSAVPTTPNNGYIVNGGLLHPGDAFDEIRAAVDVLLLPIGGPWMKIGEGIDWLRTLAPRVAVPIHQAGLAPVHQNMHCALLRNLAPAETEIVILDHAVPQSVSNAGSNRASV
ncbi:MBL fold metallo-hydrolase [Nocardia vinacea]|uniref:MBL fold metallo-hydrolase n=1 Tax=Nocardia vinacea TaxID=96468 RepID=UPI00030D9A86|nr:MBL fold metallo-hydrolase [Nocardia vinacea]